MDLIVPDRRAELMKMTKEEIMDYIDVLSRNFWTVQNNWMANGSGSLMRLSETGYESS